MVYFSDRCAGGRKVHREKMAVNLCNSLMLVAALNPHIGYDNAARAAKLAHQANISLKEACEKLALLSSEDFDRIVRPEDMV